MHLLRLCCEPAPLRLAAFVTLPFRRKNTKRMFTTRQDRNEVLTAGKACTKRQRWERDMTCTLLAGTPQRLVPIQAIQAMMLGIWVAGGVLRLRPQRTSPSIMTMPTPGKSPR